MTVEQRLEKLERTNRRLTAGLACCVSLLLSAFLMGADNDIHGTLRCERLEITMRNGHKFGHIAPESLVLTNGAGSPIVSLGRSSDNSGGALRIHNGVADKEFQAVTASLDGGSLNVGGTKGTSLHHGARGGVLIMGGPKKPKAEEENFVTVGYGIMTKEGGIYVVGDGKKRDRWPIPAAPE